MPDLFSSALYFASKDPRIVALQQVREASTGLPDLAGRLTAAQPLDSAGLVVDMQIDIWGWDPVLVMAARKQYGFPWVPNAFQPNLVDPLATGVIPSGSVATDMRRPWPRSIKVSVDAADYPAFAPPPPPPTPSASPVGPRVGDLFGVNIAAASVNGQFLFQDGKEYTIDGTSYIFHNVPTPFGPSVNWTLAPGKS